MPTAIRHGLDSGEAAPQHTTQGDSPRLKLHWELLLSLGAVGMGDNIVPAPSGQGWKKAESSLSCLVSEKQKTRGQRPTPSSQVSR